MLTYAQFEGIVGALFKAELHAQSGALRGRLKHLARLGVSFGSYWEGQRRKSYWDDDIYVAVACLDLEEAGLDPTMIANFVGANRSELIGGYRSAGFITGPQGSAFLCLQMDMMSSRWTMENEGSEVRRRFLGVRHMAVVTAAELPNLFNWGGAGSATWIVIDIWRRKREISNLARPYFEAELERIGHDKKTITPER